MGSTQPCPKRPIFGPISRGLCRSRLGSFKKLREMAARCSERRGDRSLRPVEDIATCGVFKEMPYDRVDFGSWTRSQQRGNSLRVAHRFVSAHDSWPTNRREEVDEVEPDNHRLANMECRSVKDRSSAHKPVSARMTRDVHEHLVEPPQLGSPESEPGRSRRPTRSAGPATAWHPSSPLKRASVAAFRDAGTRGCSAGSYVRV
jgi:hypothetical protein